MSTFEDNDLVKSKRRVEDHGEVFTPNWMVDDMLNLVKDESERIDSRFLESACGSGNFLKVVLGRKLDTVKAKYSKSDFENRHYALLSLMSIYGIELLEDNVKECKENLLEVFAKYLALQADDDWYKAAQKVLDANILQADALTLLKVDGGKIEFPEWGYLGSGKFQRRDFLYDALTQRSGIEGTLFEMFEEHDLFVPTKTYPTMTVMEIAK
jgi:hypothetical protein